MVKEENKFGYGIKGKLTSAVAMLLVAVIMVVSSTYAWFTLSTAPEVTGITTAVGANGALEMALLESNDPNSIIEVSSEEFKKMLTFRIDLRAQYGDVETAQEVRPYRYGESL